MGFSPHEFGDTDGGGNTKLSTCVELLVLPVVLPFWSDHFLSNRCNHKVKHRSTVKAVRKLRSAFNGRPFNADHAG